MLPLAAELSLELELLDADVILFVVTDPEDLSVVVDDVRVFVADVVVVTVVDLVEEPTR